MLLLCGASNPEHRETEMLHRAIGGMVQKFPSLEECKLANVTSSHAAASAFADHIAPGLPEGKKFRFVFCSGMMTEWDQDKWLLFLNDSRKIKVVPLAVLSWLACQLVRETDKCYRARLKRVYLTYGMHMRIVLKYIVPGQVVFRTLM
jgi:hypothetical protein